jgi:aspartate aminotransferase-like enzyme
VALERLYTPGPTPIPERIRRAMAEPIIHHRTAEFTEIFRGTSEGLKPLFGTAEPVITLAASGTGGLEAALVNCCSSGRTIVTVNAGKFGERWTDLARAYRLPVAELVVPYGQVATPDQLAEFLDAQPHTVQAVALTHSETSTGALHDVAELAAVARDRGALVMVDAITSLGVHPVRMDEWGLDAVVSGSQKGLMLPPGLAFVALSAKARHAMPGADLPRFYFDLAEAAKQLAKGTTPFTPAIGLVIGLAESLRMLNEEGLDNVFARHARLAAACRAGMRALGLPLFASSPSNGVTAVGPVAEPFPEQVVKTLRSAHGMRLAGGQGSVKGKIFRVGHMGAYTDQDITDVLAALTDVVATLGAPGRP